MDHSYTFPAMSEVPKLNHYHGKIGIDCKSRKRERQLSMYKRRPILLKKAYVLHSITGADVFCLVQEHDGQRQFYGSGELKTYFSLTRN